MFIGNLALKVTHADYPHLNDFTEKVNFPYIIVDPLKTKLRTFLWISQVPQSKFEANRSRSSSVMIGQTNKQTPKQRLQLYIYWKFRALLSKLLGRFATQGFSLLTNNKNKKFRGFSKNISWIFKIFKNRILMEANF